VLKDLYSIHSTRKESIMAQHTEDNYQKIAIEIVNLLAKHAVTMNDWKAIFNDINIIFEHNPIAPINVADKVAD